MPIEMPISASTSANSAKGKFVGSRSSNTKLSAVPSMPPVANQRAPKRSERYPEIGPAVEHAEGEREHVDARPQRCVSEIEAVLGQPDALQPDDQHEHQAAARDRREERRERAERECADAKQRQAEHRLGDAPLDRGEGRQAAHAGGEQREHLGLPQPVAEPP